MIATKFTPAEPRVSAPLDTAARLPRRRWLQTAAAGMVAAAWIRPVRLFADVLPFVDRIGLQLYTVRGPMASDPQGTLAAIAQAGYRQVELMNVDLQGVQLASIARDQGLMVHSGFIDWRAVCTPEADGVPGIDEIIEIGERIGLRHLVFGYIGRGHRETPDQCQRIAEAANEAAAKTRAAGMRMCYHNHSFEFAKLAGGDQTAFDIFTEQFDPRLVDFELDVFWVKIGGEDPIAMMRRLAGRITQVHLKDLRADTGVITDEAKVPHEAFEELGDGVIDIPAVCRLAREIGVLECHVEQDQSPDPLQSIAQSLTFLRPAAEGK